MDVNYPPYNIIDSDDGTCIEVALAGYSKDDINVFIEDNILHVSYEKTETNEENMRYKGIAKRSFKRTFALSDAIEVKSATMIDGLLRIKLKEITPETKRISVTIN
jgi:molecular chaperone IbpA